MENNLTIFVSEHDWLEVDTEYGISPRVRFTKQHYILLIDFATRNPDKPYFSIFRDKIKFSKFVGVIKVGALSIEVMPKTDRHFLTFTQWQNVLLEMLTISSNVKAKTSTLADIQIRHHSVLDHYLNQFLEQTSILIHSGLTKKYHTDTNNKPVLKGRLLFNKHLVKNIVHADRFYTAHQVYDQNNIYNSIIYQALQCVVATSSHQAFLGRAKLLLLNFPICNIVPISHHLFSSLAYDRKTERYKQAIELAKIILLNFHPDLKGGNNNILAIMFDMNHLWETYIFHMLAKASAENDKIKVIAKDIKEFWQYPDKSNMTLEPDILLRYDDKNYIIDTKWKYQQRSSIEDIRQMYVYGLFWHARRRFLLYPDNVHPSVNISAGNFFDTANGKTLPDETCSIVKVNLINSGGTLNKEIGKDILANILNYDF